MSAIECNSAQYIAGAGAILPQLHSFALICLASGGKICVVGLHRFAATALNTALIAFGSTSYCSARRTTATAGWPLTRGQAHG